MLEYSLYPFKEHIGNFDSVSSSWKCYVLIKGGASHKYGQSQMKPHSLWAGLTSSFQSGS